MEQKKLEFRDILSECINNPQGEIAATSLNEALQNELNEATAFVNALEKNAESLKEYRKSHSSQDAKESAKKWYKAEFDRISIGRGADNNVKND